MESDRYYMYVIYSGNHDKYYRGMTSDPKRGLQEHNEGISRWTLHFRPWEFFYLEAYETKKEALIREKILKKYSKEQLQRLKTLSHPNKAADIA